VYGFRKAAEAVGTFGRGFKSTQSSEQGVFARMKRVLVLIAGAALLVGVFAQSAPASKRLIVGIYDEAETLGSPERSFPIMSSLRVKAVRANLYWGGPSGVAQRRPSRPTDPDDPAYNWFKYDRMVREAAKENIRVVFAIVGTPSWANGARRFNRAPRRAIDLRNFAQAAATRYSGTFIPNLGAVPKGQQQEPPTQQPEPLPAVRHWLAWNEPNNPIFLFPQYRRAGRTVVRQAAKDYARICNAVVAGIHRASALRSEKIACGVTAPRGNNCPRCKRPSISAIPFARLMKRYGARGFDAFAHHPYYGHPRETPSYRPNIVKGPRIKGGPVILGNIGDLTREVSRLWGRKPIWITEYGYQTPPDIAFRVSYAQQAKYLKQAFAIARKNPRIDMMLWFLLRDQPRTRSFDGWQSGLMKRSGGRKPAFRAFQQVRK
jgi:Glycosyl hydrolase catalytic core